MNKQKREVISLIRVACAPQDGNDPQVEAQRAANQKTAQVNGLTIRREVVLSGVSGHDVLRLHPLSEQIEHQHPAFEAMLKELEGDAALAGIVVADLYRIIRPNSATEVEWLGWFFKEHQKIIYLPGTMLEMKDPQGQLIWYATLLGVAPNDTPTTIFIS